MSITFPTIPADRVTEDAIERKLYSRDLAPVPAIMVKPFFRTLPDAVIRPGTAEHVAEVMRQAARGRIPVTPRAAASTSYYNSVPVRGGWVLDVNDLRDGIELDAARQTVRVLPATTWFDLDDALQQRGFAVKSYPSSAVSATVGGWVSMQGHGMGSLKYGGVGELLISLQVALPNGELVTVTRESDPPLDWFVAAEGTLGVITQVELTIRPRPAAESHHLFAFDDLNTLGRNVVSLARAEPRPFTVFFADSGYLRLLARAGFHIPLDLPQSHFPVSEKGLLLVSFQGEPSEVNQGKDRLTRVAGCELSSDLALEEWNTAPVSPASQACRAIAVGRRIVAADRRAAPLPQVGQGPGRTQPFADRHLWPGRRAGHGPGHVSLSDRRATHSKIPGGAWIHQAVARPGRALWWVALWCRAVELGLPASVVQPDSIGRAQAAQGAA